MSNSKRFKALPRSHIEVLKTLDLAAAPQLMPWASSDEVRLIALHKARYECHRDAVPLRVVSAEWLRARGLRRLDGRAFLPPGQVPGELN